MRGQMAAVQDGVRGMFVYKRTDCIDPLLDVLEGYESLKDHAIRSVFVQGASRRNETWMRGFYNHPAIIPTSYGFGLITCGHFICEIQFLNGYWRQLVRMICKQCK